MTPPSSLVITIVADLGRAPVNPEGQLLIGSACRSSENSPGCWIFRNAVLPSGVNVRPVISQPRGPVRKRQPAGKPDRPGQHAIWIQQSLVKIFVVHDQQAMIGIVRAGRQREKMHAIVMHARLHGLVRGGIGRIRFERWPIGYRIAPCKKYPRRVTRRHHHGVCR